jgi:hypothetical protein
VAIAGRTVLSGGLDLRATSLPSGQALPKEKRILPV